MYKKSAKEFMGSITCLTLGVILMLPEVELLTPLGLIALCVGPALFSRQPPGPGRLWSFVVFLVACVVMVTGSLLGDGSRLLQARGPRGWYVTGLLILWVVALTWECVQWHRHRPNPPAA